MTDSLFEFSGILASSFVHWLRARQQKANVFSHEPEIQTVKRDCAPEFDLAQATSLVGKNFENLWIISRRRGTTSGQVGRPQDRTRLPRDFPQLLMPTMPPNSVLRAGISTEPVTLNKQQPILLSNRILLYLTPFRRLPKIALPSGRRVTARRGSRRWRRMRAERYEKNLPTQQPEAQSYPWVPRPHGNTRWSQGPQCPAVQRSETPVGLIATS